MHGVPLPPPESQDPGEKEDHPLSPKGVITTNKVKQPTSSLLSMSDLLFEDSRGVPRLGDPQGTFNSSVPGRGSQDLFLLE